MDFIKYPSHENHYREKFIEMLHSDGHTSKDVQWVATEKLHGSCYALYTNGAEVKAARRSGFLEEGEKFYNHKTVFEDMQDKILQLYKELHLDDSKTTLIVYGELVGGGIQKGVNYAEGNDFYAFDVLVFDRPTGEQWVDWDDQLLNTLDKVGIKFCPVLYRGTFDEVIQLDNTFNSHVNAGGEPFTAEGFVMKPVKTVFLHTGSRVSLKSKTEKFSEKAKAPKKRNETLPLSEDEQRYVEGVPDYITENRFNNVLSKEGAFEQRLFGKYLQLLILDAIEDFCKDNELNYSDLEKVERKRIQAQLVPYARDIIKTKT